ncbi:MAG: class I SAM-dependent methyltransferase [Caldilineaceae bacterium]|nr:class I SAM-dependent methyltransferase [Caldilineaceae bacterium]
MSTRTYQIGEELHRHLLDTTIRDLDVLQRLRAKTARMSEGGMQISPEQGQFMQFLIHAIGARRALEIGTFTGYSALVVALALPDDGRLVACDVSDEYTSVGRPFWEEAGVAHKIDLRLGPGTDSLQTMLDAGEAERFDFAFIDADKPSYERYYELCLKLVRRGGVIAIDNTLWGGRIADQTAQDESTQMIRSLNQKIRNDPRVDMSLVPIGDGLMLACKR